MRRPSLVLVVVCSLWGSIGVVVRQVPLSGAAIACARIWVAAAGLGLVLLARRGRGVDGEAAPALFSYRRGRVVLAGAVLALHWTAFIAALQRAPIGTVVLIVFLGPVGVALAAPRVLGERLLPGTVAALALAVGGFVLVATPAAGGGAGPGLALAGVAAASFVVLVLASKPLAEVYGGLRLAFCELAVAGVALLPVGLALNWGSPRASWLWLLVLGLAHTAAGVSLYLAALGRVPAVHAGILGYLEPATAVLFGWVFLSERPGVGTVFGGLLIVAAGVVLVRSTPIAAVEPEAVGLAG